MLQKIIDQAHSWLGTRFKYQAGVKINNDKGGCDCLGLIIRLRLKSKLGASIKDFGQTAYSKFITSNILQDELDLHFDKKI